MYRCYIPTHTPMYRKRVWTCYKSPSWVPLTLEVMVKEVSGLMMTGDASIIAYVKCGRSEIRVFQAQRVEVTKYGGVRLCQVPNILYLQWLPGPKT